MRTYGVYTPEGDFVRFCTRDEYKRSLHDEDGLVAIDDELFQVKYVNRWWKEQLTRT